SGELGGNTEGDEEENGTKAASMDHGRNFLLRNQARPVLIHRLALAGSLVGKHLILEGRPAIPTAVLIEHYFAADSKPSCKNFSTFIFPHGGRVCLWRLA